jgi:hypothetical protein
MTPPPVPILRHSIHLTRGDLLGVMCHLSLRQKSTWIVGTLLTAAIAYTMITGKTRPANPYEVAALAIILLVIWLFLPLFSATVACLTTLATAGRQPGLLGLHEFEIREDGFLEKTGVNESLTRWEGIQEVKESRSHLLIRQTPGLIHIIPRRSFTDPQHCRHFVDSVRGRISDAKKRH